MPTVFLDISIDGIKAGRITIELFTDACPKAVENFRALCTGEKGKGKKGKPLHYKGNKFHKIVYGSYIEAGDIIKGDGSSGESIYGPTFPHEPIKYKHVDGIVSMCCKGPDTNNSKFLICCGKLDHLDKKHMTIGKVIGGMSLVRTIEKISTDEEDIPSQTVVIYDCGELK